TFAVATKNVKGAQAFGAVVSAPIVEESAKAIILFIFFLWKKDEFDGVLDGLIYAGMVGLGFAMTENIQYYGRAFLSGQNAQAVAAGKAVTVQMVFFMRGIMSPFSHPLFTSMTGMGLGLWRQTRSTGVRVFVGLLGFGLPVAMLMHAVWNGAPVFFGVGGFVLMYLSYMLVFLVVMPLIIIFALVSEGRTIRKYLLADFQRGLLSQQDYECVCSLPKRFFYSCKAASGGYGSWRARRQFHQAASELAFHRSRVERGIFTTEEAAREREAAYVYLMQELRRRAQG
ncbi:MAG TPA: PrsW family intramembrane metalloprotease, partial [Pyrinomonadaceae bacterium]